jgi:hypothetical protein
MATLSVVTKMEKRTEIIMSVDIASKNLLTNYPQQIPDVIILNAESSTAGCFIKIKNL